MSRCSGLARETSLRDIERTLAKAWRWNWELHSHILKTAAHWFLLHHQNNELRVLKIALHDSWFIWRFRHSRGMISFFPDACTQSDNVDGWAMEYLCLQVMYRGLRCLSENRIVSSSGRQRLLEIVLKWQVSVYRMACCQKHVRKWKSAFETPTHILSRSK